METRIFCEERKRNCKQLTDELNYASKLLETRGLHPHDYQKWLKVFEEFILIPLKASKFISFYAEKTETFSPDDFIFAYAYDEYYLGRGFRYFSESPKGNNEVWLSGDQYSILNVDAPFVYILELKTPSMSGLPIMCVLSFCVDLRNQVLFIHQIQGGNTYYKHYGKDSPKKYMNLARRARFKFKNALPELFVYDAVENLATNLNLKYIAIRRPQFNRWHDVRKRAVFNPGSTLYGKVSKSAGFMLANKELQNKLPSINTEVYFWKRIEKGN